MQWYPAASLESERGRSCFDGLFGQDGRGRMEPRNKDKRTNNVIRLVPARPQSLEDAKRYLPHIPWRYIALVAIGLMLIIAGYKWKEQRKAVELRAHIAHVHQTELANERTTYMSFRSELEALVMAAAQARTDTAVVEDFRLQDLPSGRGVYLRIPLASASGPETIAQAAKLMQPDHIPSCLGLSPTSARELYEVGEILTPGFVRGLEQKSVMQLRVQDDTLTRRMQSDLPSIMASTRSDWFMLVLEEGKDRHDEPVRVMIWDLRRDSLLVRARVRSQRVVLTTRILSQGSTSAPKAGVTEDTTETVNDCSIAAALKKLTEAGRQL